MNKGKKKILIRLLIGLIISVVIVLVIGVKVFIVGHEADFRIMHFDTVSVEDNKVILHGDFIDSISVCGSVKTTQEDGVVYININEAVASVFNKKDIVINETFDEPIDTIYVGEYVIYDQRVVIDKNVSYLYAQKTPYIGNISEVNDILDASRIYDVVKIGNKSLQTTSEPYGLTINIEEDFAEDSEDMFKWYMGKFSAIYMGCIENLGVVTWKYKVCGEAKTLRIDTEETNNIVGEHIKDIAISASKLQETMEDLDIIDIDNVKRDIFQ